MEVDVVRFTLATGVAGHRVVVLITQISLISEAVGLEGLTVTVLKAVPFCVGVTGFEVDWPGGTTFVLPAGVFLQTLTSCPIIKLSQSQPGLALLRSSKVQPSFSAIL
jgi:hypothetical protein